MKVLAVVTATLLLCSGDARTWDCSEHCVCDAYYDDVKVSCYKRGIIEISKLKILPKIMSVCFCFLSEYI